MRKIIRFCLLITSVVAVHTAGAANTSDAAIAELRTRLIEARADLPILDIKPSQLEGFYEVTLLGGQRLHVRQDGEYIFASDLYRVSTTGFVNITEVSRNTNRKQLLDELDESQMVVFAPPRDQIKATVTVFTDVDCVYCRKLHQEVPEYNELGIAIRYLAYPRAGIGSDSYKKLVSTWCADNPQKALTLAKLGEQIADRDCENPVASQYRLGSRMGVNSTPSLIYEDGSMIPGYVTATDLAQRLGIL